MKKAPKIISPSGTSSQDRYTSLIINQNAKFTTCIIYIENFAANLNNPFVIWQYTDYETIIALKHFNDQCYSQ